MNYLNSDGSLNALKVAATLKTLAKSINDSIYYCFDDLTNDKRLLAIEAHNKILEMSADIERNEDEFFK